MISVVIFSILFSTDLDAILVAISLTLRDFRVAAIWENVAILNKMRRATTSPDPEKIPEPLGGPLGGFPVGIPREEKNPKSL